MDNYMAILCILMGHYMGKLLQYVLKAWAIFDQHVQKYHIINI